MVKKQGLYDFFFLKKHLLNVRSTFRGLDSCKEQHPCSYQDTGWDHDLPSWGQLQACLSATAINVLAVLVSAHLQQVVHPMWEGR